MLWIVSALLLVALPAAAESDDEARGVYTQYVEDKFARRFEFSNQEEGSLVFRLRSRFNEDGTAKTLIRFRAPATRRNDAYLLIQHSAAPDEGFVFRASTRKSRRSDLAKVGFAGFRLSDFVPPLPGRGDLAWEPDEGLLEVRLAAPDNGVTRRAIYFARDGSPVRERRWTSDARVVEVDWVAATVTDTTGGATVRFKPAAPLPEELPALGIGDFWLPHEVDRFFRSR